MKKPIFRLISIILCLALVTGSAVLASAATAADCTPSIVIPGVFQSDVNLYDENGNIDTSVSKPFYLNPTKDIVMDAVQKALLPLSKMLITQEDKDLLAANAIADVLGSQLLGKVLSYDENGELIYDIRATKYGSVASCSSADRTYIYNQIPLIDYARRAGENNLYFFSYYSFDNIIDLADELYAYIQRVKQETGSDKVNIVPISQGGTLANALFERYPDVKNDLDRVIFIVPALDGTSILGDIFTDGLIDDDSNLYSEMFPSLLDEESQWLAYLINIIVRIMPNANLNAILDVAVDTLISDYIKYCTCMWALVPSGDYPEAADKYLSGAQDAELRAQTDWYYQAQLNSDENILGLVDAGVEVFDVVDYNCPLYSICDSWDDVNADGIIQVDSTSMGATSYGVNVQLPEGYVSSGSKCTDPTHNHIDPHNILDASTGLLPETTFYFYNQNHEQTARNDIIISLATELLIDNSFVDVYSYPDRYPQFNGCRLAKNVKNKLAQMKSYDVSSLSAEDAAALQSSIARLDAALADTVADEDGLAEYNAAVTEFEAICAKIENGGTVPETHDDVTGKVKKGFLAFVTSVMKFFSDLLFKIFGGKGFIEF